MFAVNCQATALFSHLVTANLFQMALSRERGWWNWKENIHSMFIYEIKHWKTSNRIIEYVSLAVYAHWQAMLTNIG